LVQDLEDMGLHHPVVVRATLGCRSSRAGMPKDSAALRSEPGRLLFAP